MAWSNLSSSLKRSSCESVEGNCGVPAIPKRLLLRSRSTFTVLPLVPSSTTYLPIRCSKILASAAEPIRMFSKSGRGETAPFFSFLREMAVPPKAEDCRNSFAIMLMLLVMVGSSVVPSHWVFTSMCLYCAALAPGMNMLPFTIVFRTPPATRADRVWLRKVLPSTSRGALLALCLSSSISFTRSAPRGLRLN